MNLDTLNYEFEEHRKAKLIELIGGRINISDNEISEYESIILRCHWEGIEVGVLGFGYPYDDIIIKRMETLKNYYIIVGRGIMINKSFYIPGFPERLEKCLISFILKCMKNKEKLIYIIGLMASKFDSLNKYSKGFLAVADRITSFNVKFDENKNIIIKDLMSNSGSSDVEKIIVLLYSIDLGTWPPSVVEFMENLMCILD